MAHASDTQTLCGTALDVHIHLMYQYDSRSKIRSNLAHCHYRRCKSRSHSKFLEKKHICIHNCSHDLIRTRRPLQHHCLHIHVHTRTGILKSSPPHSTSLQLINTCTYIYTYRMIHLLDTACAHSNARNTPRGGTSETVHSKTRPSFRGRRATERAR